MQEVLLVEYYPRCTGTYIGSIYPPKPNYELNNLKYVKLKMYKYQFQHMRECKYIRKPGDQDKPSKLGSS